MNGKPLGIGVIGCGYWGVNYVRVFHEMPQSRTVAVCETRKERKQELMTRFPGVFITGDIDELLACNDVNAVAICTEATFHYNVARTALLAGKHVVVEKPLTTDVSEAEELTALAERNGVTLMVAHTFLYNTAIHKLKEYVSPDRDQVYYMHARRTNLGPIRHDVNALWDLATHDIAIFNYLLDSTPEWVSAVGSRVLRNGREDIGFISLGYPAGILGNIHVSWADPNKAREVVVVCSDKRIVFDDLNGMEQIRVFEKGIRPVAAEPSGFGEYNLQIRDGDIVSPKIEIREPLKEQCRHFVDCVQSGRRPLTGGREGTDVIRVLKAIDRSVALRGAQVEVEKHDSHPQNADKACVC